LTQRPAQSPGHATAGACAGARVCGCVGVGVGVCLCACVFVCLCVCHTHTHSTALHGTTRTRHSTHHHGRCPAPTQAATAGPPPGAPLRAHLYAASRCCRCAASWQAATWSSAASKLGAFGSSCTCTHTRARHDGSTTRKARSQRGHERRSQAGTGRGVRQRGQQLAGRSAHGRSREHPPRSPCGSAPRWSHRPGAGRAAAAAAAAPCASDQTPASWTGSHPAGCRA
jgi:hypothetical protein